MERIKTFHPHWQDFLLLEDNGTLKLEAQGSTGRYTRNNERLTVLWHKYEPEEFILNKGKFYQYKFIENIIDLREMNYIKIDDDIMLVKKITLEIPESHYHVTVRLRTSDIPTFQQIFTYREYDSSFLPENPKTIVDLGANIGLAAIYFGLRYPEARILSVEPERENFSMLCTNTKALGQRILCQHAAVWNEDGWINLHTEDNMGNALGAWGVQVSETQTRTSMQTRSYRLETLLAIADIPNVDILKVDIEGAEMELFESSPERWLDRVGMVIVETHDRFKHGSEAAVRAALTNKFEELPRNGENLFFRRK